MTSIYSLPAATLLILALAITITAAGLGQIVVHRLFRSQDFIAHNEVGGILIAVSGTLYAVILGFLTVVAWQHYQEARELVVVESDADIDAWHTAVGLPSQIRERVRADMVGYARLMIEQEWPSMRAGTFDSTAPMISMDAINAAGAFVPANMGQSNAQVATLQELGAMHDARQQRIASNDSGVSWFEWLVLVVGAVCIISFCWLFGLRNARMQLLMTSTVVTIIVSILVLLFELQYPFRSDIGIGPEAWKGALDHIHEMQAGKLPNMRM
ncbi:MAG TPA: hypothetical protein VGF97_11100 [Rhizomicrobium sp.]